MAVEFETLGLNPSLIDGLKKEGIFEPTDIQAKTIPLALENKDVIGQSETGSGKTLAYLLPIFQKIDASKKEMQAIILAPTHELAMQIDTQIKNLSMNSDAKVTSTTIIGEVNIKRQIDKLKEKPHIVVGSTGRIIELIKKKKISAHTIKTIVIDEGDRLLDVNNLSTIKDVIKTTMRDRQLMMFSATVSDATITIAKGLMKDAQVVKVDEKSVVNPNIDHMYFVTEQRDKIDFIRKIVASLNPNKAIVFVNKNDEIQITTSKLQFHNLKALGIFGNASKEDRKKALDYFRTGKIQLLVASDIAARGLDIKDVTHIINLDLPPDSKDYLHRVGRTGRAGKTGTAITLVTKQEEASLKKYARDFNIDIPLKDIYKGQISDADKILRSSKPATKTASNKPKPKR